MLHSENEYKAALKKLRQNEETLEMQRAHFVSMSLTEEQIKLGLSPLQSFYYQLKTEVEEYKLTNDL